jgi:hypothetical protein
LRQYGGLEEGTMKDSDVPEFNISYIAGIGCGDSGEGSAYAWVECSTKRTHTREAYGLTANAAKYQALQSVVWDLPTESEAYVLTDSAILHRHFNGYRTVQDDQLEDIAAVTSQMIRDKKLSIHVDKIKRKRNPAWQLLASSRGIALAGEPANERQRKKN